MRTGLRIDVDTLRGTERGVPRLLATLGAHGIRASFFFSVGPDNMGRHLWRLWRPTFLWKMLRTKAPSLYGWGILLRGTVGPGPLIGRRCGDVLRAAADAGHEIGLHAWDHHAWQTRVEGMPRAAIQEHLARGVEAMTELGSAPTCSAAPAWKCTEAVLLAKENFPFDYNSDCRGDRIFRPVVDGRVLDQVQVPVSLPTYDEVVGREVSAAAYNGFLLDRIRDDRLNVLAIHAEVEGMLEADRFEQFVRSALDRGVELLPLGDLIDTTAAESDRITMCQIPGREGRVACIAGE